MAAEFSGPSATWIVYSVGICVASSRDLCITAAPKKTKPKKQLSPLQQKMLRQKWDASRRGK